MNEAVKMLGAGKKKGQFFVKARRVFRRPLVGLCLLGDADFSVSVYDNDGQGRRVSKNDGQYGYNVRGELVSATGNGNYAYQYDDIGNRRSSLERGVQSAEYVANNLNQYTSIEQLVLRSFGEGGSNNFSPVYDLDGNQTLVKTSTGVWQVTYNGENRPVRWVRGNTVVTMDFDSMGRRTFYRETENGVEVSCSRFFYDGYLMILMPMSAQAEPVMINGRPVFTQEELTEVLEGVPSKEQCEKPTEYSETIEEVSFKDDGIWLSNDYIKKLWEAL